MKRKNTSDESDDSESEDVSKDVHTKEDHLDQDTMSSMLPSSSKDINKAGELSHENDLGYYVGRSSQLTIEKKKDLLQNPWVPQKTYDFANDATHLKRKFNHFWLDQYAPWLVYSSRLKGALCKHCVLFPPVQGTVKGVLGSFMIRPHLKFKDIHEDCRKHHDSHYHKSATSAAKQFLENVPVDIQLQNSHQKMVDENKEILTSILSCVVFCGTHDLPLRGKKGDEGVFYDLMSLKIDSGDERLRGHLDKCHKNAAYTSPKIQNELIALCGETIKDEIMNDVKKAKAYSIMADETADISGKEQLSLGLRFFDESQEKVREEFMGFVELKAQDAQSIAEAIDTFILRQNLPPENCVGLGFDGCSTMAGKEGGVQAILRKKYKRALYFHCSSHKLNLVVNDASKLAEIRNSIGTVKDIISFFRESPGRRSAAPNLTKLCETRWSEKYKSIRKFSLEFPVVVKALEKLSTEGNYNTRKTAYQLHSAVTKPSFVIALLIIAKYSALLEPVVNVLQSKSADLVMVKNHINQIVNVLQKDREEVDQITNEILEKASVVADQIDIEIAIPRLAGKQQHRNNPPSSTINEYWKRALIIPYLDSLQSSLNDRFSEDNYAAFSLTKLHPSSMLEIGIQELKNIAKRFMEFYGLEEIEGELDLWFNLWKNKKLSKESLKEVEIVDLYTETNLFYPSIKQALLILLAIPATTATVERSFSTLRRVKTWLRSTMGEERLSGLCLMSVHRKLVQENKNNILKEVLDKFAANPRRLLLK